MPKDICDIGFSVVLDPRHDDMAWFWTIDGSDVWYRTSPGGRPAAYVTRDGGETFRRQDRGFPTEQGWFTVKRQAFVADELDPVGLYMGTTAGEIWNSFDAGENWQLQTRHLPEIYSLSVASRD